MAEAFTSLRKQAIDTGLRVMKASGLARAGESYAGGIGSILMFHHVRPFDGEPFAPNRGLEIEPAFLDEVIRLLRRRDIDIVTLDEAKRRVLEGGRRFAVLTFDDGYRDNLTHALPILERHEAPFTVYVTSGFASRFAQLWWVDLADALRQLTGIGIMKIRFRLVSTQEKYQAFREIYWSLRRESEAALRKVVRELAAAANVDSLQTVADLCMDWDEIAQLSAHPLCTIGVHTITHPMLAKHPVEMVRQELVDSRKAIEDRIGKPATHLAYPVGDKKSAGQREFDLALELGFETAVTTRKGMIFRQHARSLTALPRLSINGDWQNLDYLDILLSGVPFLAWNLGRRVITT